MDVHGEFDSIEPLQATGDPFDPFALQKACLLACGIIPKEGSSLEEVLDDEYYDQSRIISYEKE